MKIIVGLGNPGDKYINTRHNVGFMAIDYIVENLGLSWHDDKKFNAYTAKDGDTVYVKPKTYMNNSGQAVQAILSYYKLLPKKLGILKIKNTDLSDVLTVIHDDLDIDLGKFKASIDSRSAGHNGVQSIIDHLKTKNFKRIRIGIRADKPEQMPVQNYVLGKFSKNEQEITKSLFDEIASQL